MLGFFLKVRELFQRPGWRLLRRLFFAALLFLLLVGRIMHSVRLPRLAR